MFSSACQPPQHPRRTRQQESENYLLHRLLVPPKASLFVNRSPIAGKDAAVLKVALLQSETRRLALNHPLQRKKNTFSVYKLKLLKQRPWPVLPCTCVWPAKAVQARDGGLPNCFLCGNRDRHTESPLVGEVPSHPPRVVPPQRAFRWPHSLLGMLYKLYGEEGDPGSHWSVLEHDYNVWILHVGRRI